VSLALKSAAAAVAAAADTDADSSIPFLPSHQQRLPGPQRGRHNDPDDFISTTIEQQDSADLSTAERGRQPAQQQGSAAGMLRPPPQDVQPGDVTLSISFGEYKGLRFLQCGVTDTALLEERAWLNKIAVHVNSVSSVVHCSLGVRQGVHTMSPYTSHNIVMHH
jgi:hypothetical protein